MIQSCKNCNKLFSNTSQQSICPHKLFPKSCDKHFRYNCGNLECNDLALVIPRDKARRLMKAASIGIAYDMGPRFLESMIESQGEN